MDMVMTRQQRLDSIARDVEQVRQRAKKNGVNIFTFVESTARTGAAVCCHCSEPFIEGLLLNLMHFYPETCVRVFQSFSTLASQQASPQSENPNPDSAEGAQPQGASSASPSPLSVVSE